MGRRRNETETKAIAYINSRRYAYNILRRHLIDLNHEESWIILAGRSHKVLAKELVGKGGLSATVADPKIIFYIALLQHASAS